MIISESCAMERLKLCLNTLNKLGVSLYMQLGQISKLRDISNCLGKDFFYRLDDFVNFQGEQIPSIPKNRELELIFFIFNSQYFLDAFLSPAAIYDLIIFLRDITHVHSRVFSLCTHILHNIETYGDISNNDIIFKDFNDENYEIALKNLLGCSF